MPGHCCKGIDVDRELAQLQPLLCSSSGSPGHAECKSCTAGQPQNVQLLAFLLRLMHQSVSWQSVDYRDAHGHAWYCLYMVLPTWTLRIALPPIELWTRSMNCGQLIICIQCFADARSQCFQAQLPGCSRGTARLRQCTCFCLLHSRPFYNTKSIISFISRGVSRICHSFATFGHSRCDHTLIILSFSLSMRKLPRQQSNKYTNT